MSYYNNADAKADYSYLRIINTIPNLPEINVLINGIEGASNLKFTEYTRYMKIPSNTYTIDIYASGKKTEPIFSSKVFLFNKTIYTIAVIGTREKPDIELIADIPRNPDYQTSFMRFVNLSPDANDVSVYIDKTPLFFQLRMMVVTNYIPIIVDKYQINVIVEGKKYDYPDLLLEQNKYYTTYVVGSVKESGQSIKILVVPEGSGVLNFDAYET